MANINRAVIARNFDLFIYALLNNKRCRIDYLPSDTASTRYYSFVLRMKNVGV